jgi:hypothetical protein
MTTSLNDIMQIDHVVRVHSDGTVTDAGPGVYAPELAMDSADDYQILAEHEQDYAAQAERQGWDLMTGYSGQVGGARSFLMHPSEYIGGGLERDILARPGLYVAITVEMLPAGDGDESESPEPAGWAVARRDEPDSMFAALRQSARDARATGQIATDSELEDRLSRIAFMERQDQ